MFMFGFLKFFQPFRGWFDIQIQQSRLPHEAILAGKLMEMVTGSLFLLPWLRRSLTAKSRHQLLLIACSILVAQMSVAIYVHLQPQVPASVLPLGILGDHLKSGQRLSLQNRPTEVAGPGPVCSTLPPPVEASRFWCASSARASMSRTLFSLAGFQVITSGRFWVIAEDDPPKRKTQKARLSALLRTEIPKRQVTFIAEESKIGKTTIASALANANHPRIPWRNVSMSDVERDAAGITAALKNRPGHPDYETMETWIESRIPEDEVREDFFIRQTVHSAANAQSVLMLLGDMHVDAAAEKLTKMGHHVSTNHDLFPIRRWE